MSILSSVKKATAGMVLNGGVDPVSGGTIKKNMSLGNIKANATDEAVYYVAAGLSPCLAYQTLEINRTTTNVLELE